MASESVESVKVDSASFGPEDRVGTLLNGILDEF